MYFALGSLSCRVGCRVVVGQFIEMHFGLGQSSCRVVVEQLSYSFTEGIAAIIFKAMRIPQVIIVVVQLPISCRVVWPGESQHSLHRNAHSPGNNSCRVAGNELSYSFTVVIHASMYGQCNGHCMVNVWSLYGQCVVGGCHSQRVGILSRSL